MAIDAKTLLAEFASLRPQGGFGLIYCDPPWAFENWSAAGAAKGANAHYACESLADLQRMPVSALAARNAALAMWATFPMLPEALALMAAWGATYKTGGAWAKKTSTGKKIAFGTGYIFRSAAEVLLIGTWGEPKPLNHSTRNLWLSQVREHSRKPDDVRADLARLFCGPRIELFARQASEGWAVWGNEVGKFAP
ncbi:MAG: DNA methyltransferase [Alphaproteobacteria bacterium]|nr:DNA methyltransferase [Alphaproteobacteria bacterium]